VGCRGVVRDPVGNNWAGSQAVLDFRLTLKRVLAMLVVCRPPTATYIASGRLFNEAVEWIHDRGMEKIT